MSHFIKQHILDHYSVDPSKISVIQRSVDTDYFNPKSVTKQRIIRMATTLNILDEVPILLVPGRLSRWKGQSFLLEVLSQLKHLDFLCIMIGDSSKHPAYVRNMNQFIQQHGLFGKVKILDAIQDMPAAYMLSDLVICPSTKPEAFGRVPVEAQAMERLVLALNHGGVSETVLPGETGWLTPVGDKGAFASAIEQAILLPTDQRIALGKRARAHAKEHFNLKLMHEKTFKIYDEILARVPAASTIVTA